MENNIFSNNFLKYFSLVLANTEELRQEAYKIRYNVYCVELAFEKKEDFPDQMEFDEFDLYSDHLLLVHKDSGKYAGTVRLVKPSGSRPEEILPLEKFASHAFEKNLLDLGNLERGKITEVSRLAVPGEFRRRQGEKGIPFPSEGIQAQYSPEEMRNFPLIAVSLYLGVAAIFILKKYEYSMVMMEPRLARRVTRLGIMWQQAGEAIEYHGLRAPYYITPDILVDNLKPATRDFFNTVSKQIASQL